MVKIVTVTTENKTGKDVISLLNARGKTKGISDDILKKRSSPNGDSTFCREYGKKRILTGRGDGSKT